jgi:hypothetical protein
MPDATERKALTMCSFVSGCISLGPREWVSAGALIVLALILFFLHRRISARERALLRLLDAWVPPPATAEAAQTAPAAG